MLTRRPALELSGKSTFPNPSILMRWLAGGKRNRTLLNMTALRMNQLGDARTTLAFTLDGGRFFVVASAKKFGVAEVTVFSPFDEAYLDDQPRFKPHAFLHVSQSEAVAPSPALFLRQVCERTTGNFERSNLLEQFSSRWLRETGVHFARVKEFALLVVADKQRV